jgi:hypothetical protein
MVGRGRARKLAAPVDQGFTEYGAKLIVAGAPFDPHAKTGGPDDDASYLARPGIDFLRPWLAVENGDAFQWPVGMQGFDFTTDPVLGSHSYIGDDGVTLDVLNSGAEALTLSGSFPGDSSPSLFQALRSVVRAVAPKGKILYIPEVMAHAQRVQVQHFEASRDQGGRGRSMTYSLQVQIVNIARLSDQPTYSHSPTPGGKPKKGHSATTVTVNATHRTLRSLADWKLGAASKWLQLYDANEAYFINHAIPKSQAPGYRLPLGLTLFT